MDRKYMLFLAVETDLKPQELNRLIKAAFRDSMVLRGGRVFPIQEWPESDNPRIDIQVAFKNQNEHTS